MYELSAATSYLMHLCTRFKITELFCLGRQESEKNKIGVIFNNLKIIIFSAFRLMDTAKW
jgi:hypothetical protein